MQGYHIAYKQKSVIRASWSPDGPVGSADTPSTAFRRYLAARPSRCNVSTGCWKRSFLRTRPITRSKYTHTLHTHILHSGRWKLGRTRAIWTSCRTALEKSSCSSIDIHAVLSKDSIVIQTGTRVSSVQLASFYKTASQASQEKCFMHFSNTFPMWLSCKYAPRRKIMENVEWWMSCLETVVENIKKWKESTVSKVTVYICVCVCVCVCVRGGRGGGF